MMFCKTKPDKVINFQGNTNEDMESLLNCRSFSGGCSRGICVPPSPVAWCACSAPAGDAAGAVWAGAGERWGRKPQTSDLGWRAVPGTGTGHLLVLLMPGLFPEEL